MENTVLNSKDHVLEGCWLIYQNYPELGNQIDKESEYKLNQRIRKNLLFLFSLIAPIWAIIYFLYL